MNESSFLVRTPGVLKNVALIWFLKAGCSSFTGFNEPVLADRRNFVLLCLSGQTPVVESGPPVSLVPVGPVGHPIPAHLEHQHQSHPVPGYPVPGHLEYQHEGHGHAPAHVAVEQGHAGLEKGHDKGHAGLEKGHDKGHAG